MGSLLHASLSGYSSRVVICSALTQYDRCRAALEIRCAWAMENGLTTSVKGIVQLGNGVALWSRHPVAGSVRQEGLVCSIIFNLMVPLNCHQRHLETPHTGGKAVYTHQLNSFAATNAGACAAYRHSPQRDARCLEELATGDRDDSCAAASLESSKNQAGTFF